MGGERLFGPVPEGGAMRKVGWTQNYRGMGRVPPSVNVTGFVLPAVRRRRPTNSYAGIRQRHRRRRR
jgi:hypothetical protein